MKRVSLILLAVLLLGIPLLFAAAQQGQAQIAGQPAQAALEPEDMFEDNPARREEALEEGKIFVPDISALELEKPNAAARRAVRMENVRPKADLKELDKAAAEEKAVDEKANEAKDEKLFEFNRMVGNEKFGADVHGVAPAETPMRLNAGKAALGKDMNLEVEMKGLRFQNDQPAAGMKLNAGIACLDNGAFMAKGEEAEDVDNSGKGNFEADQEGNAAFKGHMDFAGASCIAPTPMVTDEQGRFVAIGAHGVDEEEEDIDNKGNKEDDDDVEDLADKRADLEEEKAEIQDELAGLNEEEDMEEAQEDKEDLLGDLADVEEKIAKLDEDDLDEDEDELDEDEDDLDED